MGNDNSTGSIEPNDHISGEENHIPGSTGPTFPIYEQVDIDIGSSHLNNENINQLDYTDPGSERLE